MFFQTSCVCNITLAGLNNYMQKAPSPLIARDHSTKVVSSERGTTEEKWRGAESWNS